MCAIATVFLLCTARALLLCNPLDLPSWSCVNKLWLVFFQKGLFRSAILNPLTREMHVRWPDQASRMSYKGKIMYCTEYRSVPCDGLDAQSPPFLQLFSNMTCVSTHHSELIRAGFRDIETVNLPKGGIRRIEFLSRSFAPDHILSRRPRNQFCSNSLEDSPETEVLQLPSIVAITCR